MDTEGAAELTALFLGLETDLAGADVRRSKARLEELIAPDFLEFGSTGRIYDAAAAMTAVLTGGSPPVRIDDLEVRMLGEGIALVTYRATVEPPDDAAAVARRSSIWRCDDGTWRIAFHQSTPIQT